METNIIDRQLRVSRTLQAPIALVWEAWTNPLHTARWWGPLGFTTTISVMDVRPGGEWILTMHGPDGTDYPNKSIFREIEHHRKIVYEHEAPHFIATILFEADGDVTHLSCQMLFDTAVQRDAVVNTYGAAEGLKQNVEKLSAYLAHMNTP